MRLVDAVYNRMIEIIDKQKTTVYAVAKNGCVPCSTIATMTRSKTVTLATIYGICLGLKIPLKEFFDSPLFDEVNITKKKKKMGDKIARFFLCKFF